MAKTITATVDRIEGPMAVIEVAGTTVDWPVQALPAGTTEGSTLTITLEAQRIADKLPSKGPRHIDL